MTRVLITGGAGGIGSSIALRLAAAGHELVLIDRRAPAGDAPAAVLNALFVPADLTDPDSTRAAFATVAAGDRLDGVVAAAGVGGAQIGDGPVDQLPFEAWRAMMAANVDTVYLTLRECVPLLRDGASIVTLGSIAGLVGNPGGSPTHAYAASKGAVISLTRAVAMTYAARGVRANCVCPGAIETAGLAALRTQLATARGVPEEGVLEQVMVDEWHMDVALGRPGRPEEVGELFAFLLSPRAGYLTGATVNIDGGTDF